MADAVLYEVAAGVATITLNRPDALNAVDSALSQGLLDALAQAEADPQVRAIVLTGAGRGFCTGLDLKEMGDVRQASGRAILERLFHPALLKLRSLPKPVIAAVNGLAMGGGANLAFGCDIRIASDQARFGQVFVGIGAIPDCGGHYWLPRLVGPAKAAELMWTGEQTKAEEALRLGLVNRVVPADQLMEETLALARRLAQGPTFAIGRSKQILSRALDSDLPTVLELEAEGQEAASKSEDFVEGISAFLEKRKPAFRGK